MLRAHQQTTEIFKGVRFGLEKESLRTTQEGTLALTPHPRALGATLTHPWLTTDYAECLMEFITPPLATPEAVLAWLHKLHCFVYQHLEAEYLWAPSMPCRLGADDTIPIAEYGSSNLGQMRHIYRRGLGYRYGRRMQCIAGIHFNYSLAQPFWSVWQKILHLTDSPLQKTIDTGYFAMMRNTSRMVWMIPYLLGASPALDASFLTPEQSAENLTLLNFHDQTYYAPYATSLRMSDLGYQNKTQSRVSISWNNVDEYVRDLSKAIETPYLPYEKITLQHGSQAQLNANILQIEAEYYAPIRPKRIARTGTRPSKALNAQGVEYIELRAIDINPYLPLGIDLPTLYFLEIFLLWCLIAESPPLLAVEKAHIAEQLQTVVREGHSATHHAVLAAQAERIFEDLLKIAVLRDTEVLGTPYQDAIHYFEHRFKHLDSSPAAQSLADMRTHNQSFLEFGLKQSIAHKAYFKTLPCHPPQKLELEMLAQYSLQERERLEREEKMSFKDYLGRYFA